MRVVVVVAALGLVWSTAIVVRYGARTLQLAFVSVAVALVSMNGLRATEHLTAADIFLILGLGLAVVRCSLRRPLLEAMRSALLAIGLIAVGGLLGIAISGGPGAFALLALTGSATVTLLAVASLRLRRSEVVFLAATFALGTVVNAGIGFAAGLRTVQERLEGLALHPNHLGLAAALGVGAALYVGQAAERRSVRMTGIACVPILFAAVGLSGSRAALVGACAVIILTAVLTRDYRLRMHLAVFVGAVVIALWSSRASLGEFNAFSRLTGGGQSSVSNESRFELAGTSLHRIATSPIIGDGFTDPLAGHSVPLQLWQGAGLFGVLAFALLVRRAAELARRTNACALAVAYIGYLVAGMASNQLWDRMIWVILVLAAEAFRAEQSDLDRLNGEPIQHERRGSPVAVLGRGV